MGSRCWLQAGRDVETRVVFTHDRDQTVERVAIEVGATAILLPNETLLARGLPDARITLESTVAESPIYDIVDRSDEFDVIVMGEGGQPLLSALLGDDAERIAEGAVSPVLVVRGRPVDE